MSGPAHPRAILAIVLVSYFLILLDNSVIFTALPSIATSLDLGPTGLSWVQDAYTLRCAPQIHGVVHDTIQFVRNIISVEMNSATDNPMVFTGSAEVTTDFNPHPTTEADESAQRAPVSG